MKSNLRPCIMKVPFGALVITAGVCGILSFAFLATSLGTDHWYIIEMNPMNATDFEDVSSHSGLWRINEGGKIQAESIDSFSGDSSKYTETELRILSESSSSLCLESHKSTDASNPPSVSTSGMHGAIVVMLPFSLVLLLFGGICGLVSSLARSPVLLTSTAFYFFVCSLKCFLDVLVFLVLHCLCGDLFSFLLRGSNE
ncbi:hypothetical protein XENORESO_013708 [Xenotaenia resolanae]|uniref:Uncharacterized protein n=1 Tax=Xenotaenia resolanae TaxID=208358 RepID=A0ABV0WEJ7_9TELE